MLTSRTTSAFQAEKRRQAISSPKGTRRSSSHEPDGLGRRVAVAVAAGAAALVLLGAGSPDQSASPDQPADVGNHPIVDIAPVGDPGSPDEPLGGMGEPLTFE